MNEYGSMRYSRPLLRTAILLAVAVAIVWFIYSVLPDQRLNLIERQFLGQWSFPRIDNPKITTGITFRSDRVFELNSSDGATGSGTWEAKDGGLLLSLKAEDQVVPRFIPEHLAWYVRGSNDERLSILEIDETEVRLSRGENTVLVLKRTAVPPSAH